MKALLASLVLLLLAAELSATPCNLSRAVAPSVVEDTEGASQLAEALNCSGGVFDIEWVGSVTVSKPITIVDGTVLTIRGAAGEPALVDGENQSVLFIVNGATLHMSNLTLANGLGSAGGAIWAYLADITLVTCVFVGNNATLGGAIFAGESAVQLLDDTRFTANTANYGGGVYATDNTEITGTRNVVWEENEAVETGGAIFTSSSRVAVTNCTFVGNNAAAGGAIFADDSTVRGLGDTRFTANTANTGGGIYAMKNTEITAGSNVEWDENAAESAGGAIFMDSSHAAVTNCTFVGNNATLGGAIFAVQSTIRVWGNSRFTSNTATTDGGGIYAVHNTSVVGGSNAVWDGNVAVNGGGAIYIAEGRVSVTKWVFVSNNARFGGAVVALRSSTMHLMGDTVFTDNSASDSGGGIYADNRSLVAVVGDAVWERNSADFGGGIFFYLDCFFNVSGSATFVRNSGRNAAGVWLSVNVTIQALTSSTLTFHSNAASEVGGGMLVSDANAKFLAGSTVVFSNNTAGGGGGGMCLWPGSIANLQGKATFTNNTAATGGGTHVSGDAALRHYGDVIMSGNTASSGGAIYGEATEELVITNTEFISNVATVSGGAVTLLSSGTKFEYSIINTSSFHQNTAGDAGGAVFIAGGFLDISVSDFIDNVVGRAGGALLASGFARINGCVFSGNRGFTGPAISNTVSIQISSAEFDGNALLCGDGLFLDWTTNVSAYESACEACPGQGECLGCVVRNPDTVQLCELALQRTTSRAANGTLESLELESGYWRSSNTSKDIRECYEADACIGGREGPCKTGYMGPFCTVCIDGYARGMGRTCSKCTSRRRRAGVIIAAVFVMVLIAGVGLRRRFYASPSAEVNPERTASSRALQSVRSRLRMTRPSQALKIIVVSWQIITQFATVASVTYPQVYDSFLKMIDVVNLNLGWMLSASCLVETDFYDGLLLSTLMPLVIGCVVLVSYVVLSRRYPVKDEAARARLKRRYGAFFFWVSFLLYTTTSSAVFHTFACDDLDNGESYLRIDHRLSCHTEKHKFYMAYAAVMGIVYPLGIPFCYMFVLYRSRSRLKTAGREDDTEVAAFRELWWPYSQDAYYYEVIECFRRIVLSGIVVFIFPNTAGQVATAFLLALVFGGVLMSLNPHHDRWDAWLARAGHVVVMMSMFVALLQKVDISEDDMFSRDVFAGVLVLANCGMVLAAAAEASGMCYTTITEIRPPAL